MTDFAQEALNWLESARDHDLTPQDHIYIAGVYATLASVEATQAQTAAAEAAQANVARLAASSEALVEHETGKETYSTTMSEHLGIRCNFKNKDGKQCIFARNHSGEQHRA